jgi:hypothetical protein
MNMITSSAPAVPAIEPGPALQDAEGLKQTAHAGTKSKKYILREYQGVYVV